MLADDQVELGVIGHAVAFVRGTLDLGHAAPRIPAPAHVARHVREQEVVIDRMPDRPLRELEPGADLADRRIGIDQRIEFAPQGDVGHRPILDVQAGNQSRRGRV
jgi:hypothetical protein